MKDISFRTVLIVWIAIYLFSIAGFFVVVKIADRPDPIWGSDGIKYYSYVRSVVLDGDLDFTGEWENHYSGVLASQRKTDTGVAPNKLPVGFSLFAAPFFLLGHLLYLLASLFGYAAPPDGYSPFHEYAVCIGSMSYGLAGILLSRRLVRKYFSERIAFVAITSLWLSTNLIYYFFKEPFMSHLVSMATVALFLNLWHDGYGKQTWGRWLLLGLVGGLMATVRLQNAAFFLLPSLELVRGFFSSIRNKGRSSGVGPPLRNILVFAFAASLGFMPQCVVWKKIYGSYLFFSYQGEWFNWLHPRVFSVLFSTNHGLFTWAPLLVPAVVGLYFLGKRARPFALYFSLAFLVQVYINAAWWIWWFGFSYGARTFLNCMPIFIMGLAAFLDHVGFEKRRRLLLPFLGLALFYNVLLMVSFETGLIPLEGEFSFLEWFGKLGELPARVLERL